MTEPPLGLPAELVVDAEPLQAMTTELPLWGMAMVLLDLLPPGTLLHAGLPQAHKLASQLKVMGATGW